MTTKNYSPLITRLIVLLFLTTIAPAHPASQAKKSIKNNVCTYKDCNKKFVKKSNLNRHIRLHAGEKPFACTYQGCKKAFTHKSSLRLHIKTHTRKQPFACTYPGCKKVLSYQSSLTTHLRTHTGEKLFACMYPGCNKAFYQKINLTNHTRTHTGEKPFTCTYPDCNKAFTNKQSLTPHMRTHINEKPFTCIYQGCNKAFAQKSNLKTHVRIHTRERPFVCNYSQYKKAFLYKTNLNEHLKIHEENTLSLATHYNAETSRTQELATSPQPLHDELPSDKIDDPTLFLTPISSSSQEDFVANVFADDQPAESTDSVNHDDNSKNNFHTLDHNNIQDLLTLVAGLLFIKQSETLITKQQTIFHLKNDFSQEQLYCLSQFIKQSLDNQYKTNLEETSFLTTLIKSINKSFLKEILFAIQLCSISSNNQESLS